MGKRRTLLICVIAAGLVLVAVLALELRPAEPSYEGKSLSHWIERLADADSPDSWAPDAVQESVRSALHQMGTNATLLLADWACCDRPRRRKLLQKLPRALHRFKPLRPEIIDDPYGPRGPCAAKALIVLGAEATPAFPKLGRALIDGEYFGVATRALWILREIGKPAVPTLAAAMTNKPSQMREIIAFNLGQMGHQASAAVPALKSLVGDPNPVVNNEYIQSIEFITGNPFTNAEPEKAQH